MNLGTLRCTDEVKQAVAMAQQYANCGYTPEALITTLGKIACRDNFTEMHAYKHHQETHEEFYATRPSLRWHHLVAAVRHRLESVLRCDVCGDGHQWHHRVGA